MMYSYILVTLLLYLTFIWVLAFHFGGRDLFGLSEVVYALTHADMKLAHAGEGRAA